MMDIDLKRVGWPWALNTFSWVEPTAWSCFALQRSVRGGDARVQEGLRLLLDRAFDQGGINYGNRLILGKMTDPIPTPTALMVLALQGHTNHPRVQAARRYLRNAVLELPDLEHLAWAILALNSHGDDVTDLTEKLALLYHQQRNEGRPLSISRRALAILALDADSRQLFILDATQRQTLDQDQGDYLSPPKPQIHKRGLVERIKGTCRGVLVRGIEAIRTPPACAAVHIASVPAYDKGLITASLKTQFNSFREHVPLTGKRIVLKPNLVEWHRDKVINTDPRFVDAVIQLCLDEGAKEVVVAEGPGHWRNVEFLVEQSGMGAVLRSHGVRFVDLNHDEPIRVLNLGRTTGLEFLYLTKTIPFHADNAIDNSQVRCLREGDVDDTVGNTPPMQLIFRPAIANARQGTEQILQRQRCPGPVMRF